MNSKPWELNRPSTTSSPSTQTTVGSSLAPLPPSPPRFPSLAELVAEDAASQMRSTVRPRGLYQELLQSNPDAMHVDSLEHPEKYSDSMSELLRDLANTRRAPTEEERLQLDAAVLDFVASPRPRPEAPKPITQMRPAPKPAPKEFSEDEVSSESPDVGGPLTVPRAFWWL
jgi:hypothetical protein